MEIDLNDFHWFIFYRWDTEEGLSHGELQWTEEVYESTKNIVYAAKHVNTIFFKSKFLKYIIGCFPELASGSSCHKTLKAIGKGTLKKIKSKP